MGQLVDDNNPFWIALQMSMIRAELHRRGMTDADIAVQLACAS